MRRGTSSLACLLVLAAVSPALAVNPSSDILVPAAYQGTPWVTDVYVLNPGAEEVAGTVYWLPRSQANPDPVGVAFSLAPGETEVMAGLITTMFGLDNVGGAFRVVADGEVMVNSRIYAVDDAATFGQGFSGIPMAAATAAGQSTFVVGLSHVAAQFRTNFYACAGADGATMTISLRALDGSELATRELVLRAFEPYLERIDRVLSTTGFTDASLMVTVTAGSAVAGASKVDEASGDPTTLESSVPLGSGRSRDGTYQFAIYDSETFATGGNVVIADGQVTAISGTYANWDKDENADSVPDCVMLFLFGLGLPVSDLADVADGVSFTDSFAATGSGDIAWTLQFEVADNSSISGTLSAVGSAFPSSTDPYEDQSGCNGAFPTLTLLGGKVN